MLGPQDAEPAPAGTSRRGCASTAASSSRRASPLTPRPPGSRRRRSSPRPCCGGRTSARCSRRRARPTPRWRLGPRRFAGRGSSTGFSRRTVLSHRLSRVRHGSSQVLASRFVRGSGALSQDRSSVPDESRNRAEYVTNAQSNPAGGAVRWPAVRPLVRLTVTTSATPSRQSSSMAAWRLMGSRMKYLLMVTGAASRLGLESSRSRCVALASPTASPKMKASPAARTRSARWPARDARRDRRPTARRPRGRGRCGRR